MKSVALCAGGTAGHINAALALGQFFCDKEYKIRYFSGTRYLDKKLFPSNKTTFLSARPLRGAGPHTIVINNTLNLMMFAKVFFIFLFNRPKYAIGAGGYVCGPVLAAAWLLRIPVYLIEQNAVCGLTNRILSKISKCVFTHFEETNRLAPTVKTLTVGNPVRSSIKFCSKDIDESINVLVFGGSLGATQINEALELLVMDSFDYQLSIIHQVGKENVNSSFENSKISSYKQVEYIEDMQAAYNQADIIIARAGASTVSELRIVQKPSLLIPFPAATDNHQYFNAQNLKKEDLFFVGIIDHSLKGQELTAKIRENLDEIVSKKCFNTGQDKLLGQKSAQELIYEYVTNLG